MPGLESKGAPAFEGNYSSYSQKWQSAALPDPPLPVGFVNIDVVANRVILVGDYEFYRLNLINGEIIEHLTLSGSNATYKYFDASIKGKYVAIIDGATQVRIYKDGVLLQTLTITGANVLAGVGISYDGQYIIIYDNNTDTIYCFQGS